LAPPAPAPPPTPTPAQGAPRSERPPRAASRRSSQSSGSAGGRSEEPALPQRTRDLPAPTGDPSFPPRRTVLRSGLARWAILAAAVVLAAIFVLVYWKGQPHSGPSLPTPTTAHTQEVANFV